MTDFGYRVAIPSTRLGLSALFYALLRGLAQFQDRFCDRRTTAFRKTASEMLLGGFAGRDRTQANADEGSVWGKTRNWTMEQFVGEEARSAGFGSGVGNFLSGRRMRPQGGQALADAGDGIRVGNPKFGTSEEIEARIREAVANASNASEASFGETGLGVPDLVAGEACAAVLNDEEHFSDVDNDRAPASMTTPIAVPEHSFVDEAVEDISTDHVVFASQIGAVIGAAEVVIDEPVAVVTAQTDTVADAVATDVRVADMAATFSAPQHDFLTRATRHEAVLNELLRDTGEALVEGVMRGPLDANDAGLAAARTIIGESRAAINEQIDRYFAALLGFAFTTRAES